MQQAQTALQGPRLTLVVIAVMVALYGIDKFLAAREQSELQQAAAAHYTAGQALLHAGKADQAVTEFVRAVALRRDNRQYQIGLAGAQLSAHRLPAARDTLTQLLDQDSNDGEANLLMARALAAEGRYKDASTYYHRAVYGEWPPASAEPVNVRRELAHMLAEHGQSEELLSELLLLRNQVKQDPGAERQVAQMFLHAGSPANAAAVYRDLIAGNPDDIDSYLGLVGAEIMLGDYRAAENAALTAIRRQPYSAQLQSQLRLVVTLASLDPTFRHLTSAEKYRRSEHILELVQSELEACVNDPPSALPKVDGPVTNEMAEARLDEAEKLWTERGEVCKQPPARDDPLPLLMKKLLQ